MNLKTGHLLKHGEFRVEKVLAQGGFGITYLCEQTGLLRKVAIKEFFMREYCERDDDTVSITLGSRGSRDMVERFRQKFIKEARALAALNHKHIVRIIDVFEENNTAYYVMDYVGGGSLADKVNSGALPEAAALRYIRQIASALDFVHGKRMMHLDVKPANILLNENDEAILIDFGLAKQYDASGSQTSTTPVGISHGYAPLEQYKQGGVGTFSPATDIYSLGATLYKLLTGVTPPEAGDVKDEGRPALPQHISAPVRAAIEAAMQPRRKDRPKSISEFLSLLDGNVKAESGKVKTESNDDGATVIASSSTLGGEVSRSDGGENVEKSKEERVKSKDESDGAIEILRSAQNDKKHPGGNVPKPPFNKFLAIISVVAACIIAVLVGIDSCNDRRAANNNISTRSYTVNGVSFKMIAVEGGTFKMGATAEQQDPGSDEKPVHNVTLSNYCMGETEVTQALWQAVMGSNPSRFAGSNNPVEKVSYDDCITFINKLNTLLSGQLPSGRKFRLPTEAEWEYAARGGNRSRGYRYSGSDNLGSVAWYTDNSGNKTHQVKQKQANELGLYDMSGNVWEWCNDWFGDYSSSSQTNPKGPLLASYRVLRGGSWINITRYCRVANRNSFTPDFRVDYLGLRLAL